MSGNKRHRSSDNKIKVKHESAKASKWTQEAEDENKTLKTEDETSSASV
jgi:hypothetical protein